MLRYGDSDFQPADPKSRGKWSDDDTGEGDSGYDVRNGERTAAADDYRDEDVRYVDDARQMAAATAPPHSRSETSRSSRNSSKNRVVRQE